MAYLSQQLLYIHPVKTGGCWVERQLERRSTAALLAGGGSHAQVLGGMCALIGEQHSPLKDVLSFAPGREVIISVRDPWTWYGSLYLHGCHLPANRARLARYGRGSTDFKDVLFGLTHPCKEVVPEVPLAITNIGRARRSAFCEGSEGLYSWHFRDMGFAEIPMPGGQTRSSWLPTVHLRQASLSADFDAFFGTETAAEPPQNHHLRPPDVKTPAGPYREWYDAEMLSWVEEADGEMAAFLDYSPSRS